MIYDIFMPALSSTMTEGKIVSWTKSPGDKVAKGETVLVVESDKADMDVESFYEGYLATILVEAGQEAPVGAAIAYIAETEAEIAEAKAKAGSSSAPTPAVAPPVASAPEPSPVAVAVETSAPVTSNGKND
ncbi:MAG: biotin/lipoyl-containing protein, partial [Merismopediaceae bacterium]|nr:biotin/lipoyl-containing protein [Merismopediaceae bacterium]